MKKNNRSEQQMELSGWQLTRIRLVTLGLNLFNFIMTGFVRLVTIVVIAFVLCLTAIVILTAGIRTGLNYADSVIKKMIERRSATTSEGI